VSRLQKELDSARASYQNLQKIYQEQCSTCTIIFISHGVMTGCRQIGEAEKYRDSLRRKDMELKDSERYVSVLSADVEKVRICPFTYPFTSLTAYAVASTV